MRRWLFALCVLVAFPWPSFGAQNSPRAFVRQLEGEMRKMMRAGNFQKANLLFAENFDALRFAKRCMVDHWDELSANEKLVYTDLLQKNIRKRMSEKALLTKEDVGFKLIPKKIEREEDGIIRIDTLLEVKKGAFSFGIFLVYNKGQLQVADYDIDGALLSRNYRSQFNYVIRQQGISGLLAKLETQLEDHP